MVESSLAEHMFQVFHTDPEEEVEDKRVSTTVRMRPEIKERLVRLALAYTVSINSVMEGVLDEGSLTVCKRLAELEGDSMELFKGLAYGEKPEDAS